MTESEQKALDTFVGIWGKLFTAILAEMNSEQQEEAIIQGLQFGHKKVKVEFELPPLKMRVVITDAEGNNEQLIFETAGGFGHVRVIPATVN